MRLLRYTASMKSTVLYWKQSAERDWKTAQDLWRTKHYDACLFFCHLTLEKALKFLATLASKKPAPYTHNLEKLAALAGLKFPEKRLEQLRLISTFNIAGRYQDEKSDFHKRATKTYCSRWLKTTEEIYLWLKKSCQNL